ncbi:PQQ-like beta-propeller repeat protein [Wenxinia marina]|uniref:PQQ-like beta-propeller repeat protein n=1 Tax=Wenxinia marina TaxID=390641 RepID=UPI0003752FA7|nr:PQQ-like beta-propeller repeat protein [Wenxinia marina]GGL57543.1 pyrrolo-quinoline quinone [Wenxinia marina]
MSALAALVLLGGCGWFGPPDVVLPGPRQDIRPEAATSNVARPIALPAAQVNASWPQRGGSPAHRIGNLALSPAPTLAFATGIGQGDTRGARITADPVVANGVVYTLDASAIVSAVSATTGQLLWQRDVSPYSDRPGEGSGGGLALAGGRLYVTTGFGRLSALDAATGGEAWVQDLNAPGGASPTVAGDLVFVVARDARAWAIETSTGRVRYILRSATTGPSFAGGAGVAVEGDTAVVPFSSGEIVGLYPEGGTRRWTTNIGGDRPGFAAALAASDIATDPVIVGDTVYLGNVSGRVVALGLSDGERRWTATDGATSTPVVAGGALFFVNDIGELVRLDAATGESVWRVPLPLFEEDRPRRQHTRWVHLGPILAGGRLIVASSDGTLRQFDPVNGNLVGAVPLPGGAASHPVVAGGVLYVVSSAGQLLAYR